MLGKYCQLLLVKRHLRKWKVKPQAQRKKIIKHVWEKELPQKYTKSSYHPARGKPNFKWGKSCLTHEQRAWSYMDGEKAHGRCLASLACWGKQVSGTSSHQVERSHDSPAGSGGVRQTGHMCVGLGMGISDVAHGHWRRTVPSDSTVASGFR